MDCFIQPSINSFTALHARSFFSGDRKIQRSSCSFCSVIGPRVIFQRSFRFSVRRVFVLECDANSAPWNTDDANSPPWNSDWFWKIERPAQLALLNKDRQLLYKDHQLLYKDHQVLSEKAHSLSLEIRSLSETIRREKSERKAAQKAVARFEARSLLENILDRRYAGGLKEFVKRDYKKDSSLPLNYREQFYYHLLTTTSLKEKWLPKAMMCEPELLTDAAAVARQLVIMFDYFSTNAMHARPDSNKLRIIFGDPEGVNGIPPVDRCLLLKTLAIDGYTDVELIDVLNKDLKDKLSGDDTD
eukprot:CAMPEP_0184673726 /NCGR_PEP_ID=MMETSP0308-20130426/86838_1 /TAXON_ID=38269 /ORGANISM="Gloeochaete witrockiana, Strain SAG 46.84" /LENGTH=300 /DNA_ID=CAMNT_0027121245 /DNA_START=46 /DNA_END=948 /DNA_ORIENTATION=+